MPAQLAHESSSDPQGAECTCNRRVRIVLDPVQAGIGKDSVELVLKDQRTGIHYPRGEAAPKSGSVHVRRIVGTHHRRTLGKQLFCQVPIPAAEIEMALARLASVAASQ